MAMPTASVATAMAVSVQFFRRRRIAKRRSLKVVMVSADLIQHSNGTPGASHKPSLNFRCAVKRRWSTAGDRPARELVRSAR
jgi:hypothetical protein